MISGKPTGDLVAANITISAVALPDAKLPGGVVVTCWSVAARSGNDSPTGAAYMQDTANREVVEIPENACCRLGPVAWSREPKNNHSPTDLGISDELVLGTWRLSRARCDSPSSFQKSRHNQTRRNSPAIDGPRGRDQDSPRSRAQCKFNIRILVTYNHRTPRIKI
jgi:hypothetical protein